MEMKTGGAFYAADKRTYWQRLVARLFPVRRMRNFGDLDGFAPSYMSTFIRARIDWRDRLRLLVSGRLHIEVQTKTDVAVSKMVSQSVVYVLPPAKD